MVDYRNHSNNSNHPIIRTPPPFPGKMLNFCIPSIRTPTFEIINPTSEHLHLVELERGSLNVCRRLVDVRQTPFKLREV